MKPRYKVAYKLVTDMEWKCCHGYGGADCNDGPAGGAGVQIPSTRPQPRPGYGGGGAGHGAGGAGGSSSGAVGNGGQNGKYHSVGQPGWSILSQFCLLCHKLLAMCCSTQTVVWLRCQ